MDFQKMPTINAVKNMSDKVRSAWVELESAIFESRSRNAARVLLDADDGKKLQPKP